MTFFTITELTAWLNHKLRDARIFLQQLRVLHSIELSPECALCLRRMSGRYRHSIHSDQIMYSQSPYGSFEETVASPLCHKVKDFPLFLWLSLRITETAGHELNLPVVSNPQNITKSSVRIKVSHHNKIKQDRHYCIYIRFIISIIRNMFRLLVNHLQVFFISSIS
jgi:hypothetical protein